MLDKRAEHYISEARPQRRVLAASIACGCCVGCWDHSERRPVELIAESRGACILR